ncbi:MAG: phosphoserine phosphatase [Methanobrevibacter sp.]|nr:phosphoserine phosphatase [Methanobrevibacter sp.]
MKYGKGIIKKYSREYNRTLKNGEKKKYTTEQIQITVPKNEDIYENKEEVLIIPNSEIDEFKNIIEENEYLKVANYLHVQELEDMQRQFSENTSPSANFNYEEKMENLRDKHSKLIIENENLKTKFVNIKTENENLKTKYSSIKEENKNLKSKCHNLREEHASIRESYNQVSSKYDQLKQENLNTKTSYAEIYEINEDLEKDYDTLRLEYNDLVDKYNELEEELYKVKSSKSRDEYIANKVKEFILKSGN